MDELCLASLRGAVDLVPDCSVISVGSDPAGDKHKVVTDASHQVKNGST